MQIRKRLSIIFMIIALVISSCVMISCDFNGEQTKKVLMIYMIGSDLEPKTAAASTDLEEVEKQAGNIGDTEVVVYTGGTNVWHNDIPADKNCILELTDEGFITISENESTSMGESDTLTYFLDYVYNNYEGDEYSLILWNHGSGPMIGYGFDSNYADDSMTLKEMQTALENSPFGGENKLSWIGFDACLMASAELAIMVSDYADYLVASQEIEPYLGWDYGFVEKMQMEDAENICKTIIDSYIDTSQEYFDSKEDFDGEVTLSCLDLSYATELEESINGLFSKASSEVNTNYNILVKERVASRGIGRFSTNSEYDLVDIEALATQMTESYPEDAQKVLDLLEKMIVYNKTNTKECCGVSLYYPYYNKGYYDSSWRDTYKELGILQDYQSYLTSYEQIWLGADIIDVNSSELNPTDEGSGNYSLTLTEKQAEAYARGSYRILKKEGEDLYQPVFYSTDVELKNNTITANYSGKVVYISHLDNKYIMYLNEIDSVEDEHRFYTNVLVENNLTDEEIIGVDTTHVTGYTDGFYATLKMTATREDNEFEVVGIYPWDEETEETDLSTGKKEEVDTTEWGHMLTHVPDAYYLTRDENNNILPVDEWDAYGWIRLFPVSFSNGYDISYENIYDDGSEYFIIFEFADTQNNLHTSELIPITLSEAPEEEKEEKEAKEYEWNGDEVVIYDENDVRLTLQKNNRSYSTKSYILTLENNSENPIQCEIENILLNDLVVADTTRYLTADANVSVQTTIDISDEIWRIGEDNISTLSIDLSVQNTHNEKYYEYRTPIQINMVNVAEGVKFEECLGAYAKEQIIYEDSTMRTTLMGLGRLDNDGTDELYYILCTENLSEKEIQYAYNGMNINGVYYYDSNVTYSLQPGKCKYTKLSISNLGKYNEFVTEDAVVPAVNEIESIDIFVANNQQLEESMWSLGTQCTVNLTTKGKTSETKYEIEEVVYDENDIQITYIGTYYNGDEIDWSKEWTYCITNNSDKDICLCIDDCTTDKSTDVNDNQGYFNMFSQNTYAIVPAHSKSYVVWTMDAGLCTAEVPTEMTFTPQFLDANMVRGDGGLTEEQWEEEKNEALLIKANRKITVKEKIVLTAE